MHCLRASPPRPCCAFAGVAQGRRAHSQAVSHSLQPQRAASRIRAAASDRGGEGEQSSGGDPEVQETLVQLLRYETAKAAIGQKEAENLRAIVEQARRGAGLCCAVLRARQAGGCCVSGR